jgi:molybdopterin-guanine dinucleotide biosynthesis protein A
MTMQRDPQNQLPLTAVLLAGGQSRRMGTDKAMVEIDGVPLWSHQVRLLASLEPVEIVVSGPRRSGFPAALRNLEDEGPSRGPLTGLATTLRVAPAPDVIVLAIDLPEISTEFLTSLRARASRGRGVVPCLSEPVTRDKFYEPLVAIYPVECLPLVVRQLAGTDWSMQNFVRAGITAGLLTEYEISAETRRQFRNLNSPGDRDQQTR